MGRSERRAYERALDSYLRKIQKRMLGGHVKKVVYQDKFLRADGQPFVIADPDVGVQERALAEAKASGKDKYDIPLLKASFGQVLIWFINEVYNAKDEKGQPVRRPTIEDAGNGYMAMQAFRAPADGYVELADNVYTWLLNQVRTAGPEILKITAAVVLQRLEQVQPEPLKAVD